MPSDDREQQFERALARHFRGGAANAACPDAEILAAYHERTLAPVELEQWKKHIADCARCQETLALVESSELALEEQREKEVFEHLQHVSALLPAEMASAPTVWAAPAIETSVVAIKAARTVKSVDFKRSKILRWAAPLGAIAALLILWLGVRHSKNSFEHAPAQSPVQVAENRESRQEFSRNAPKAADEGMAAALTTQKTVPPGDYSAHENKSAPKPNPPMVMLPRVNGPTRSAGVYAQRDNSFSQDRFDKKVQSEAAQGKLLPPRMPLRKSDGVGVGSGAGAAAGAAMPATAAPAPPPPPVVASDAAGANAMSMQADANAPSPSSAKSAAAARAKENKAKEETPAMDTSSTSQAVAVESSQQLASNRRNDMQLKTLAAAVAGGNVITAPKGRQGWRVQPGGLIEHTSDGGKSWKAQKSGVTVDLISGTAPTEKICWVVGKAGVVLLTTDGGNHWKELSTPVGEDLARVEAMDAQHAKIWSAGDNAAYVTDNGGLSWSPASGMK